MSTAGAEDRRWLRAAIDLSRRCPPSRTAYAVGAIVVDCDGAELARGHSRESHPYDHAEEAALAKLAGGARDLAGVTLYTSMEPCSERRSRARTCTELILATGLTRVVYAVREPSIFVECHGVELLRDGGVEVVEIGDLGHLVLEINSLPGGTG